MSVTRSIEAAVRARVSGLATPDVEIVDCDPALADTAAFCAAYGYAMEDSANAIVVIGKSDPPRFALCLVLATTRLDVNKAVRARLGTRKASFAPADTTMALTGMTIGGVTPFAVPDGLPIWVDAAVMGREPDRRRRRQPPMQGGRPTGDGARAQRRRGRRRPGVSRLVTAIRSGRRTRHRRGGKAVADAHDGLDARPVRAVAEQAAQRAHGDA